MKYRLTSFAMIIFVLISAVFQPQSPAYASGSMTIAPLTWNVIGLDSNLVTVGPNHFPIGARVCNTSTSPSTVSVTYNWDDGLNKYTGNTYINLRGGTLDVVSLSLNAGQCKDAYFEVEVTRSSSAYDKTRAYTITANDGIVSASTPAPRELFVEHLISQSRNSVLDMQVSNSGVAGSFTSIAPGGTMTLVKDGTYWIKLVGATATNGYEQIETFINFPNTIFQVESVDTTYSVESSSNLAPPYDKLYGDGCTWENDPNSPNYRSCLSTGKAGGDITVTYKVKIISVPASPLVNPEPLSTLIYDFSGSSYHYNADYGVSTRYVYVLDPSAVPITKSFTPAAITPGGTSQMTINITNPGTSTITGVNFTDTFPTSPAAMTTANTTTSTIGCGTPTLVAPIGSGSYTSGAASIAFSDGTIAPGATCTIKVNVTAPTASATTYDNTTGHLYINSTTDTGNTASAKLTVGDTPAPPIPPATCSNPTQLALWDFSNYSASTTTNNGPFNASSQTSGLTNVQATYGSGMEVHPVSPITPHIRQDGTRQMPRPQQTTLRGASKAVGPQLTLYRLDQLPRIFSLQPVVWTSMGASRSRPATIWLATGPMEITGISFSVPITLHGLGWQIHLGINRMAGRRVSLRYRQILEVRRSATYISGSYWQVSKAILQWHILMTLKSPVV